MHKIHINLMIKQVKKSERHDYLILSRFQTKMKDKKREELAIIQWIIRFQLLEPTKLKRKIEKKLPY